MNAPLRVENESSETILIPVVAEQLHIDKKIIETGRVRLVKTVQEEPQTVQIPLVSEGFDIERVTLNQYVDQPPLTRQEGDTTIYPVLQEVLVVEKRLLLVEEVRVTKRQQQTTHTQTVLLRREDVRVERIDGFPERSAPGEPSL